MIKKIFLSLIFSLLFIGLGISIFLNIKALNEIKTIKENIVEINEEILYVKTTLNIDNSYSNKLDSYVDSLETRISILEDSMKKLKENLSLGLHI